MTLSEILTGGGLSLVGVLTLLQVSKIQINPWSYLFKQLGRAINQEVFDEMQKISNKVDKLESDISDVKSDNERGRAEDKRARILRFGDELLHDNKRHTKDTFDSTLIDITDYKNYCRNHMDFKNDVTVSTVDFIEECYKERLKNKDF